MGEFAMPLAALLLGGGVLTGSVWWVVTHIFSLKGHMGTAEQEIDNIHSRCHGREIWLRDMSATLARVDKNVVRLAAKMDVEIED